MNNNEFILIDRIAAIKATNEKADLNINAYISFSGGKDSTILHHLIDEALPNNRIPRVYIDTGIEYQLIREFVYNMAKNDDRFVIVKPTLPIKATLEKYGYPFKSKEHSLRVEYFNKGSNAFFIKKYLSGIDKNGDKTIFCCPSKLLYQFEEKGKFNYSNKCCYQLKKFPIAQWQKDHGKSITITGLRRDEGGNRKTIKGCILTNKSGKVIKFHPLLVVDEDFEEWYIKTRNIKLCKLYYPPFNFVRTGCKGCPYNLNLQKDLDTMEKLLPNERKACEIIWKPVYDEYRRIGYRLNKGNRNNGQTITADF